MRLLGIETSCDDTSAALIQAGENGFVVLAEKTASQVDIHAKYGGVVPEIAGRAHAENIFPVIEAVMDGQPTPDCIAVTAGPGLVTGLVIGVEAAKALSYLWDAPLVAVNHIAGHIHSVELGLQKIIYPALALVVSGGHTELIFMKKLGSYELIGKTRDDAAGECFDKVAKLLGFDYPGGPRISQTAETGNALAIPFPRPMLAEKNFDFSFSGLKTSALYYLRDRGVSVASVNPLSLPAGVWGNTPEDATIADFCASFETAIIDVLVGKTLRAATHYKPKTIVLGGGVSANKKLRHELKKATAEFLPDASLLLPDLFYAMDNGAMIAVAGYYLALDKKNVLDKQNTTWREIKADPSWEVNQPASATSQ